MTNYANNLCIPHLKQRRKAWMPPIFQWLFYFQSGLIPKDLHFHFERNKYYIVRSYIILYIYLYIYYREKRERVSEWILKYLTDYRIYHKSIINRSSKPIYRKLWYTKSYRWIQFSQLDCAYTIIKWCKVGAYTWECEWWNPTLSTNNE